MMDDDEGLLRELTSPVLGVLVRGGADIASAEDAAQEALIEAVVRPDDAATGAFMPAAEQDPAPAHHDAHGTQHREPHAHPIESEGERSIKGKYWALSHSA